MGRALLAFVGCGVVLSACSAYVPEKVTADGLLAIRNGMTYGEVETLIGPPLCVVSIEDARFSDAERNFREAAELSLSYAEPRASFSNPNVYVNLEVGRVTSVYIKKDDYGICCIDGLPTSPFYSVGGRELLRELVGR